MNRQELATFLRSVALFQHVTEPQLDQLTRKSSVMRFKADQTIYDPSDGEAAFYVLIGGEAVEYVLRKPGGMEVKTRRLYPGDWFGIEPLVQASATGYRVHTLEDGRAVKVDRECIDELLASSLEFTREVCRWLAERTQRALDLVSGIRYAQLSDYPDIRSAIHLLPSRLASATQSLAVQREGDCVTVAMVNCADIRTRSFIEDVMRDYLVQFVAISEEDFDATGRRLLGERIEAEPSDPPFNQLLYQNPNGAPCPLAGSREDDLLSRLITIALRRHASDIHFEPYQGGGRVRLRIDGQMVVVDDDIAATTYRQVVARLKVLAELDTTRIRRPQEGRFMIHADDSPTEFRISASPCHGGEKVVLRIVSVKLHFGDLSRLILQSEIEELARELFRNPSGLVLVTGPSGAGKTTTLYAALKSVIGGNTSRNIVTIEDPVEYDLPFATQIQIQPDSGMGFAEVLRSVLRQDPDVILVGEIRDAVSAAMAAEAATTGHLVLSSLHTYSALDAVVRLRDLHVPSYVIAAALRGVITQQLVPRLAPEFTQEVPVNDPVRQRLVDLDVWDASWDTPLVRGRDDIEGPPGGESGRVGIFEVLTATPDLSAAVDRTATRAELNACLTPESNRTYRDYARFLLREGIVAPERIIDVLPRGVLGKRIDRPHFVPTQF